MIKQFKSARNASVPLLAIETFDQQATIRTIGTALNGDAPIMLWDIIRGLTALNNPAIEVINEICNGENPAIATGNPAEMLAKVPNVPAKSIIFFMNVHRYFANTDPTAVVSISQGMMNLRDIYKSKRAMLVLLGPYVTLPDELKQDVMVISEPLPDYPQIEAIIQSISNDAGMKLPKDIDKIADTLVGLSAFSAEQTLATCIEKNGKKIDINRKNLWDRKCKAIEQTDGLTIWKGNESFDTIGGSTNVKEFLGKILTGKNAPRSIVFIDEIDKLNMSGGDTSGTSQDQLSVLLKEMQDNKVLGMIFIGPPGSGKSVMAKSAGNYTGIPTISMDFGSMKNQFVGNSEQRVRQSFKVIWSVSQGRALFIATCNGIATLPPELRRRFSLGTFYFDLPTDEEKIIIWNLKKKEFGLIDAQCDQVNDQDWTGAEIENCCRIAWMQDCKLSEAAKYVVPVAKSAFEQIDSLRKQSSGKYISANKPGLYQYDVGTSLSMNKRAL